MPFTSGLGYMKLQSATLNAVTPIRMMYNKFAIIMYA